MRLSLVRAQVSELVTKHKRKKIFTSFSIPLADLPSSDEGAVALFGFKRSSIYKMQIPILVFVNITHKINTKKMAKSEEKRITPSIETNCLCLC